MRKLFMIVTVLALCYGAVLWFAASKHLCQILFVPIGNFPTTSLQKVADYYKETLGVHIDLSLTMPFDEVMMDRRRGQFIGEELVNQMRMHYPVQTKNQRIMMIGFTRGDMYIRHMDWRFAFAYRESGRFAAVSTARMDPESFGLPPDDSILVRRLIKITSKQIGLYFYGLPERQEKTSVLFSPILGVDDLDTVAMDFDAIDRERMGPTARQCNSGWIQNLLTFLVK
jgi:predicted Zn-dependent protease